MSYMYVAKVKRKELYFMEVAKGQVVISNKIIKAVKRPMALANDLVAVLNDTKCGYEFVTKRVRPCDMIMVKDFKKDKKKTQRKNK